VTPRLESFQTAIKRLVEVLGEPETGVSRDAAIQRFEFCFELAWKAIQERAKTEGLECYSPKQCFRLAFTNQWLRNETGWLAMLEDRNRTSHTYDEELAKQVYRRLPGYISVLEELAARLKQ